MIMYVASFGKQVVQMLFVNCDSSMLYYPFYRTKTNILKSFTYRFKQTFYYNSLIVIGMFLLFLILHMTHDFLLSSTFFDVLLSLLISLSLLFSFHELFIYYLLQPFTSDLSVKNPLCQIITGVFYGFSYMNMSINIQTSTYVVSISIISLLYVAIGFMVIYRVAPKTFRVKN